MISRRPRQPTSRQTKRTARLPLTKYYRARPSSAPSPFKQKPPKKSYRKYWFGAADVVVVALIVIAAIFSLSVSSSPKIDANSLVYRPKSAYQAAAAPALRSFKNRNKITFDETAVIKAIEQQFPEVQSAKVELPFFSQTPVLHLSIAPPAFTLISSGSGYVIDSAGVAVANSASLPQVKGLPTVSDQSGFQAAVGKQVLSASDVGFIETVMTQCQHAKVPVSSLVMPARPQELDLRAKDQPYFVKFYLDGNALQETGQFLAARRQFMATHQLPSQYLDVRVPGKIFYK